MINLIKNKKFLSVYLLWFFIHTILLLNGQKDSKFWPIQSDDYEWSYDLTEWLVYVVGPILMIYLWSSFNNKNNNNKTTNIIIFFLHFNLISNAQLDRVPLIPAPNQSIYNPSPATPSTMPEAIGMFDQQDAVLPTVNSDIEKEFYALGTKPSSNEANFQPERFNQIEKNYNNTEYRQESNQNPDYINDQMADFYAAGHTPSSAQANMQPERFDWEASRTDRFVNSPCYKQIGFDPNVAYDIQDKKYLECELYHKTGEIKHYGVIGLIFGGLFIILIVGFKSLGTTI